MSEANPLYSFIRIKNHLIAPTKFGMHKKVTPQMLHTDLPPIY